MPRTSQITRQTNETAIELTFDVDGTGTADVGTGVGFLDHMLTLFARHGLFDLRVRARGDLDVDQHHTVEDVGICLGKALDAALGDKSGIQRYGWATIPMDETLVTAAVDLSGRAFYVTDVAFPTEKIGSFDTQLIPEFWQAFAAQGKLNLHHRLHGGTNSHHIAEAGFKATARALRAAASLDPRQPGVPSTKGTLHG
jgi:imidazoleglycerol-phosphate dehydratase